MSTKRQIYRKIPKISPFWGAYIRRVLSTKGNLRFKIDWASLVVGSKFTVFALFYFLFESNFPSTSPRGAYIWTGLRGLYTWRGLFSEFYGILGAYIVTYSENKDDPASSIRKRHLTVLEKNIYIYGLFERNL